MYNVTFYEKEESTNRSLKSNNCYLHSLTNGSYLFYACINLTTFDSDLSSLTNGTYMFSNCSNLTTFTSDLSSLTNGTNMFGSCTNLTTFTSDLNSLSDGSGMFSACTNLTTFTSDLSSLTEGERMFSTCSNLTTFTSDLSSLINGTNMFSSCPNLTTFTSDLSSLTGCSDMFNGCSALTSFTSDLSSLTNGTYMFSNCSNLTTFTSDLISLTNGTYMFSTCTNLTTCISDLSSLIGGYRMFYKTKLNSQSVMYIADSIKDIAAEKKLYTDGIIPYVTKDSETNKYSAPRGFMSNSTYVYTYNNPESYTTTIPAQNVGKLDLGINVTNDSSTIQQQLEDFAHEATFDSWADLKTHFSNKGWKVTFQYGGTSTSITYDLRNGEQIIPCSIFAKLVEADKDSAEYCTEDALSFYNIEWGHDVTDTSSYTQFNSLEDAMTSWNVFPKENIITTEE